MRITFILTALMVFGEVALAQPLKDSFGIRISIRYLWGGDLEGHGFLTRVMN